MRFFLKILKLVLFLLVLGFALKNTEVVAVRYYFGAEWRTPLVLALLAAFCAGIAAGVLACAGRLVRQRREIAALRRAAGSQRAEPEARAMGAEPRI